MKVQQLTEEVCRIWRPSKCSSFRSALENI